MDNVTRCIKCNIECKKNKSNKCKNCYSKELYIKNKHEPLWNSDVLRECRVCSVKYPTTLEYFDRKTSRRDGIETRCKPCNNKRVKNYWKRVRNDPKTKDIFRQRKQDWYYRTNRREIDQLAEKERMKLNPIYYRAMVMRRGMNFHSRIGKFEFDRENLTTEYIFNLIKDIKFCKICEIELDFKFYFNGINAPRQKNTISIDRIDSSIGYIVSNIDFICVQCNIRKNNLSIDLILKLLKYMKSL